MRDVTTRVEFLRDLDLNRLLQPRDINRQQQVRRAERAFGLDAVLKTVGGEDGIDLDAGFFREGVEQRFYQAGFTVGVNVDFLRGGGGCGEKCGEGGGFIHEGLTVQVAAQGVARQRRLVNEKLH